MLCVRVVVLALSLVLTKEENFDLVLFVLDIEFDIFFWFENAEDQHASATCSSPVGATRRPSYRIVKGLQCLTSSKDWRELMCLPSPILMRQLQFKDSSG
ncbi:hypothetical protein TNCV_4301891 [Trichonephila clavipes]|uniref:Secreted protein n=1 Tax=Trichonephila clavipes TaxID=2585209 RepID=A0A8X6VAH7_TRICX|nr:hypothetical protein TNCV_4301891 [Trichonephila clavipes]